MPRGGYRPGAGRKSNAEIANIRKMLDLAITEDDWRALAQDLLARARKGDLRAAQLLLYYRYGDPFADVPSQDQVKQIQIEKIVYNATGDEIRLTKQEYFDVLRRREELSNTNDAPSDF